MSAGFLIFNGDGLRDRPVDKIGYFEFFFFNKVLVKQLRHRVMDFCTRLTKGIFNILPPCV